MNMKLVFLTWIILTFINSCGGGSSSQGGGIDGTGERPVTSVGTIDEFGSVIVNGVRYATDDAIFILDDESGSQADLFLGQVIELNGHINEDGLTGTAEEILFNSNVVGPVNSVDQVEPKFIVLGQTIRVDETTRFDGIDSFAQLQRDQIARVSGFINSQGEIIATHVIVLTTLVSFEITGVIENLDENAETFAINELVVDYSNATVDNDLLAENQSVEVQGALNDTEDVFIATEIKSAQLFIGNIDNLVELQGLVTRFNSSEDFSVNGIQVVTNQNTVFENGSAQDIDLDARIEVEGNITEENTIAAQKIIIIHTSPQIFTGSLQAGESAVYSIEASEDDKALWVRITGVTDFLSAFITDNAPATQSSLDDCVLWQVIGDNGFCYLDNVGKNTWYITLSTTRDVEFQVSALLRRAPFSRAVDIHAEESVAINALVGDRKLYTLSTEDSSSDAIFTVELSGPDTTDFLYIMGDQPPSIDNYDCRFRKNQQEEPVCRLENGNVEQWFIMLQSAVDASYTLKASFIQPIVMENGDSVQHSLTHDNHRRGNIYRIDTRDSDASVAASLTNIAIAPSADLDFVQIGMQMNEGTVNPPFKLWGCEGVGGFDTDEQCIMENTTDTSWYILVTGEAGIEYTISSLTQSEQPEIVPLNFGETIHVNQDAAVQAVYSLPAGTPGTAFTAMLTDLTADFDLYADADPLIRSKVNTDSWSCKERNHSTNQEICRTINHDPADAQYIMVQSANSGSCTLLVQEQTLTPLTNNVSVSDTIDSQTVNTGILYFIQAPADIETVSVVLENQSGAVDLTVRPIALPTGTAANCVSTIDDRCELPNVGDTTWYILVTGELNASFQVTATLL